MAGSLVAAFWSGESLPLVLVCLAAGLLALGFFIAILVSEIREARRKAQAKKSFERARKHFARKE